MMVSHSSSASLSSFHYSHTSSSSPSSPPSSPDYLPSSSQQSFGASSASSRSVLVPFLWEEKPGVLKKGMQIGDGEDRPSGTAGHAPLSYDIVHGRTHTEDSYVDSSERQFSKMRSNSVSGVPRLRPPPRLSQPSVHSCVHTDEDTDSILHPHRNQCGSSSRSKALSSFPFHKRRRHRTPSLEDDPFWMAMVACTNDAGKSSHMRCKGNRDVDSGEIQSSDAWLVKRVHGHTVDFKQCMPRRRFIGSTVSNRGIRSLSCSRRSILESEAASHKGEKIKPTSTSSKDTAHAHHNQQDHTETLARSAHLTRKAFKALDIAKSELHGRRKLLLQPQSPPVDISCTTRLCRKPHFSSRRNLADLLGCKNDYPFIIP